MTLDSLRPLADRALAPFVALSRRLGLTPNDVSLISFAFAIAAGAVFALAPPRLYAVAALCVLANGWLDLVDGALARELGTSSAAGDLLDHVVDRYADIAVIVGIAAGLDRYGLGLAAVTGVLMTSYLGTQIQAVGLGREYGGLLGRADRLALVGVAAVVTAAVPRPFGPLTVLGWLLVLFAVVGHATALQRFLGAWGDLD